MGERVKKIIIPAVIIAAIAVSGVIYTITHVNKEKLSPLDVELSNYDMFLGPDVVISRLKPRLCDIKDISYSNDVSLSYCVTISNDVGYHAHPNNMTLIDVNPSVEYYADDIFKDCKSALIYNFDIGTEDIPVESVDVGLMSNFQQYENARYHSMYKIISKGKGMLVSANNIVPFRSVDEKVAKKAENSERFTHAYIKIGNVIETLENFVGINTYEQDGVTLHGIVVVKSGKYYEYFVTRNQYALSGEYQESGLKQTKDNSVLFKEGAIFPGNWAMMNNVYLVEDPFIIGKKVKKDNSYEDFSFIYLRTNNNQIFKTKKRNIYLSNSVFKTRDTFHSIGSLLCQPMLLSSRELINEFYMSSALFSSANSGEDYEKDQKLDIETVSSIRDSIIIYSPSCVINWCGIRSSKLEDEDYTFVDDSTIVEINLPGIKEELKIVAYKVVVDIYDGTMAGEQRFSGEYISVILRENESEKVLLACDIPIEAVTFISRDLTIGKGSQK